MNMRCLIVDDEYPAVEVLQSYIALVPGLRVAGVCHHGLEAFQFLQQTPVDLLFLDVQMPKLTGTDLMKALPAHPKVIFTTAHREFAWDGFELNAVDFLLKPIPFERFLKAIHKAVPHTQPLIAPTDEKQVHKSDPFLYFRVDRKMVKVMVNDICYAESLKDYLKIRHNDQEIITKQTMSSFQEMLPPEMFARVHRSYLVAISKVTSFDSHQIFVGKHSIPIGSLYRNDVLRLLSAPRS